MLKRSLSSGTKDASVKALRRNEPVVLAADGSPYMSMEAPSDPLDESFLLGSLSPSQEISQAAIILDDKSEDDEPCLLAKRNSDTESEYVEDGDDEDDHKDLALGTCYERVNIRIPILEGDEEDGTIVYGVDDLDRGFNDRLRDYMLTVNAFPPLSKNDSNFIHLFSRIFGVAQEHDFRIADEVHEKVIKASSNCRARVSLAIKDVLKSYTFDATTLPEKCKKNRKRQFKYLMDAMRFARKDYLSTGAILQSAALGDVIAKVFYHGKEMGLALKDSDDKVPRPVIALAFVFMYVNMHLLCHKKPNQKLMRGRDAIAFRASLYHSTLEGIYDNGETVDWDEVQRTQTKHVHQNLERSKLPDSFTFCPLSASYQQKYQDGVYVSDSD